MSAELLTRTLVAFVLKPRDDVNGARMCVINKVICVYSISSVVSAFEIYE